MNNSTSTANEIVNLESSMDDNQTRIKFVAEYEEETVRLFVPIEDYCNLLILNGTIDSYDMEAETVMVECPVISHDIAEYGEFPSEGYKRNMFDFIYETMADVRDSIFPLARMLDAEKERKENEQKIKTALACGGVRYNDFINFEEIKETDGDIHFILTADFPVELEPCIKSIVTVGVVSVYGKNQTRFTGVYVNA